MLEKLKSKKGFFGDLVLNLLASLVTTGIAQLLLYPLLARMVSDEEYGVILTVMGVANTVAAAVGNSLNNVRLMLRNEYDARHEKGDFLPLLTLLTALGLLVMGAYLLLAQHIAVGAGLLLLAFCLFSAFRTYGVVIYRLLLDYKGNLICSAVVGLGNAVGILLVWLFGLRGLWPLAFLLGEAAGMVLLLRRTAIFREPFRKTPLFPVTARKETVLLLTTLTASLLTYLDRLLLLPLLGGTAVSVFTVASFFGKSLGILMTPMASVLLSYYAQRGFEMTRGRFWATNGLVLLLSAGFFLVCALLGDWGTGLIYPTLIEQARPYLLLANLAAILNVAGNMTQPAVLKFAPTYWQLVVEGVYCAVYIGCGAAAARADGLRGFALAVLLAALVRLLMLYGVGHFALSNPVHEVK